MMTWWAVLLASVTILTFPILLGQIALRRHYRRARLSAPVSPYYPKTPLPPSAWRLFVAIRKALPSYEVLPAVATSSLLARRRTSGLLRAPKRLWPSRVDVLVCTESGSPVAAIMFDLGPRLATRMRRLSPLPVLCYDSSENFVSKLPGLIGQLAPRAPLPPPTPSSGKRGRGPETSAKKPESHARAMPTSSEIKYPRSSAITASSHGVG